MKKCCNNCLNRQKLKSYDAEVVDNGKNPQIHSRCQETGTIHRTNKEQRGCPYYAKRMED